MKMSLTESINRFKKFFSLEKMNLHAYWRNLLYSFFIIIVILILFSFYLLSEIKNQQIFQIAPSNVEQSSLLNEKLLEKITKSFDLKAAKEKEVKSGVTTYKDPSLK